jgi:hypothetical protein
MNYSPSIGSLTSPHENIWINGVRLAVSGADGIGGRLNYYNVVLHPSGSCCSNGLWERAASGEPQVCPIGRSQSLLLASRSRIYL